jgi:TonB family protein
MYRVLCLVALGRSSEVDAAIERLVSHYPLYRPPSDELSPRMRTAFGSARLRLLPTMVQKRYSDSKAAYDRGEFATAGAGFKWVLGALSDPDISYVAGQPPLADIRTLATGFADLSEKAQKTVAPVPAPPVAVVSTPPPPAASPVPSPATTAAAAGAAVIVPTRDVARIYTLDDANVVAPVALRQAMPRFPGLISAPMSGVLEVVVDSNGAVESARILQPVQMQYDAMLLSAAKKWQYEPARLDGAPVRYVKRIQVNLSPSTEPLAQSGRRK